jgi:hypothetical protein
VLRFLLWRIFGWTAFLVAIALLAWLLHGGLGAALRGTPGLSRGHLTLASLAGALTAGVRAVWSRVSVDGVPLMRLLVALGVAMVACIGGTRLRARLRRVYVRLEIEAYRTDATSPDGIVAMFESLHKRLSGRWWRRLLDGQPSLALEAHHARCDSAPSVWLAVSCPVGFERMVETALRNAYPNCRLGSVARPLGTPPVVLRLKKQQSFIKRVKALDRFEHEREPAMNRLMSVMGACTEPAFVQLVLTPAPMLFERYAKRLYKRHEARLSRERREHLFTRDRSMVEDEELRGALDVQHRPLFFTDLRVIAPSLATCEQIASELRVAAAENRLIERRTVGRHGLLGLYSTRVQRGEGNPLPSLRKGVFASTELAALWQLPSIDYTAVPFTRTGLPYAPAPPAILRPSDGSPGTLRDALGAVTIHPQLRKQNTAVPGAVEQGKSSYLVATVAEDLGRERCAVIVLDPKGDAAEAAVSLVAVERTCTLLDFAHPRCGFNPLAVDAPADVIADYVVAALKGLFTDADIRASSDRYLRNAIIAVLAYERSSTLWDAARLLSVGEEGYSYRSAVGARVRTMPEFKEISEFFTAELSAQLADARSTTTAKLDAPVNKLARLLNSPSIKRVLLNDSLRVSFDKVIAEGEVLVVKGALGAMGAGNTSVLMQLLVGMLDAALARQQDLVPAERRVAVALKVDEAPLVLNRSFAETMALKRSAGLETVACWQTDAQWTDRDVREQLDALFAHRVYFATSSARDARSAAELTMSEFSDTIRPGIGRIGTLGHPDARMHLPKHRAIASWLTQEGRQAPFIGETLPLHVDRNRLLAHAARQAERGGRYRSDLRQPHWDRRRRKTDTDSAGGDAQRKEAREPTPTGQPSVPAGSREMRTSHPVAASGEHHLQKRSGAASLETERRAPGSDSAATPKAGDRSRWRPPAATPPDSYRELAELDGAHGVRWARPTAQPCALEPEQLDLEILVLVASLEHVLSSQIHRRFNASRATTTTQRRLKRLSDAGLVERFQFHRRDGGGVPMCYVITNLGLQLLHANDRLRTPAPAGGGVVGGSGDTHAAVSGSQRRLSTSKTTARDKAVLPLERRLRQARHDVHVAGWVLAIERALGGRASLREPAERVLCPPFRASGEGRAAIGPGDLRLPGGRTPHEFLRTDLTNGERVEVERFETVRADAIIELNTQLDMHTQHPTAGSRAAPDTAHDRVSEGSPVARWPGAIDVIVELDDRLAPGPVTGKLERYDHFIAGWSAHTRRYGPRRRAQPLVVFVCRDRARARECARRADAVLGACRAYAGEYPSDWEYPGREAIVFSAERDAHEGLAYAYGVPRLPPQARVAAAHGDPRAGEAAVREREIAPAR